MNLGRVWRRQRTAVMGFVLAFVLVIGAGLPLLAQTPAASPRNPTPAVPSVPTGIPAPPRPVLPVDINNYWARDCIRALAEKRIVTPNAAGFFYPEEPITWEEFVGVLNLVFPTGESGSWASPLEKALGLTSSANVVAHYPSPYFNPSRQIVRAEAVMALAAKLGASFSTVANSTLRASLIDANQVPDYAREGVAAALARGVVVNYPDAKRLNSNQLLTRGAAAAMLCRAVPDPAIQALIPADFVPPLPNPQPPAAPDQEMRGVWLTNIDSNVLFSKENLVAAVDRLAALNINTLYPVVWNWGYTLYPSATGQRELGDRQHLYGENSTPQLEASQRERDMLRELIELAHAKGMKVIPWFEFGFMAPDNYVLERRHPDWFTQKRAEPIDNPLIPNILEDRLPPRTNAEQADPRIWLESNVLPRLWMNPFHPQAQKFLLELVNEIVSNYDVDGFQVDDHLGLPVEFGYDPYTIALYKADHGGTEPPEDFENAEWMQWRANKISDFMGQVYRVVKARKPQAMVSVSPNPYPFSYVKYLQDWPEWERRGIVDELVVQLYRDDQNRFIWELNKPTLQESRRRVKTSAGLLSGLRGKPVAMPWLRAQIDAVRDRNFAGVSFFFYETLWVGPETPQQRLAGLQEAFPNVAQRPE
ncbi:MAG TPA: family 10 glycosylhydrolase [Trichocoleus sp.]